MHRPLKLCVLGAGPLAASIFACATASPPRELTEARQEFQKASDSPAAKVNPAGLLQAKKALDRANQEFEEHPNAVSTRDFAYVALRRTQLAEVQAETLLAAQQKAEAERQMKELQAGRQARAQRQTEQELRKTRQDLADKNWQVETDRRAATQDNREAQLVSAKLANIASVRQEPRGVVIAFPGGALFGSGRSTLSPGAKSKLNQVAAALADGEQKIVIEGHTDASGSDRVNQGLSERRAITVRNYLSERGISPERMTAVGLGGTRPLADNATPQGRASNRRVEIVVQAPAAISSG
jgi:outer membrane protein OmpA-like peptidoglycan-associated protein